MSEICRVEAVMTEDRGVLVDAQHLSRPSVVYRNIPLLTDFSGLIAIPKVGQKVVVSKDSTDFEYVEGVLAGPEEPSAALEENEFALQFDTSTRITALERDDGGYDLSIEASGDVNVKAGGNILLGDTGESVAKQNHTHPISWTDAAGSGDSGTPNEDGTETLIK